MKSGPIVIKAKLDTFEKWAEISKKLCMLYHVKSRKLHSPNKFKIHWHQIEVDRPCLKSLCSLD